MKPPKYQKIADDLRVRIESGELRPGEKLPTHEALVKRYNTTRVTVANAFDDLAGRGLTITRPTVGTFVRDRRRHRCEVEIGGNLAEFAPKFPSLADRLLATLAGPDRPLTQTVDVGEVSAPADIAERLRLREPRGILRRRIFYAGAERITISNDYYPTHLVAGSEIAAPGLIERGVVHVLDDLGLAPARLADDLFVRKAAPEESREMRWPVGAPVLIQMCTVFTDSDMPVACWESVLPGDTWILAQERRRDTGRAIRAVG